MWRSWIQQVYDWAVWEMTDDDAERVGMTQARQLRAAADRIEQAVERRTNPLFGTKP